MATIKKVSKAKNLSAGPSKKTPIAPKVDPQGAYTKVQERTLGSMKKGGKIKKAQGGDTLNVKKYLEDSKNRVNKIVTPLRKAEVKKGINTYDDYLKSKVKEKPKAKDGKWIQKAVKTMRTDKPCTGPKFGSKTCPPGSKRYNLAKTFKKMSKKK